jgi:hypothetical protein
MSQKNTCNFSKGEGIPYRDVAHLLHGTRKSKAMLDQKKDVHYFLDENVRGYGWGSTNNELEVINQLELQIGSLTQEIRDLRTMVDFCCIWRYDYPLRVHLICQAIGDGKAAASRCHYQVGTDKRDELTAYARALEKWLGQNGDIKEGVSLDSSLEGAIEQRVNDMLGDREPLKEMLAERTLLGLASRHIDCSFFGSRRDGKPVKVLPSYALELDRDWRSRMRMLEKEIQGKMGSEAFDFLCEVGGAEPPCHFKFIRRLEILLGSIGCLTWRGYLPPKDSKVSGRRQVTQDYLSVLSAYWSDGPLDSGKHDHTSQALERELFDALGEPQPFKKWLVASLWKNIKNQTEHQAFTMKHWVEFVQIMRDRVNALHHEG